MNRVYENRFARGLAFALMVWACSDRPSTGPSAGHGQASASVALGASVPGTYQLMFLNSALQPVTSLVAGQAELVLGAHVQDGSGAPATRGSVTFEYCSLKGLPPNDPTRADEAPVSACLTGQGSWRRLLGVTVNASGNAHMNFGLVKIPRTIGFRFRYASQGGFIQSGVSAPADFTWVAGS